MPEEKEKSLGCLKVFPLVAKLNSTGIQCATNWSFCKDLSVNIKNGKIKTVEADRCLATTRTPLGYYIQH